MADITQFVLDTFDPVRALVNSFIVNIPGIVGAIIVLIVGYVIGIVLGNLVHKILDKLNVDEWLAKVSKAHPLGDLRVAELCGKLVKWYVFIAFLATAAGLIQLTVLAKLLTDFAVWAPHLLMAVIFTVIGLFVAEFAALEVTHLKLKGSKVIGAATRVFILVFFAISALREVGLDVSLAQNTFLIVVGGIMLAFAIAVGLGMQGHVNEILSGLKKSLK